MPRPEKFSRLTIPSLALNAGLTVSLLLAIRHGSPAESSRAGEHRETSGQRGETLEQIDRQTPASTRDGNTTDWKESLKQSGVPRHVFIAAIQADFQAKWSQRDVALQKQYTNGEIEIEDLALLNLDREIALEATLREALGEAAFREWDRERKFFDINTGVLALSADEADKLHGVRTELTERLRSLERSKLKKEIDPATYDERYENAQADYEDRLRKLVGFKRFDEARESGLPAYLRRELRGLGITQAQFAQIQEIEGAFGDGRADLQSSASSGAIDAAQGDQEQEALADLRVAQLQQILGEKAYALYRKQQDVRYQTMVDFAPSWRLSAQDVENVFQLLHAHETETRRIKLSAYAAGLSPEKIQDHVSGLQARLNESLLQTLSPEQVEKLRRNGVVGP